MMENSHGQNPINDEFLLQCICNYKPLYDKGDKGYKSILQKENCWSSVARSLNSTVPEVKSRYKALREKYRREVQMMEKLQRSGAPASARPVWPLLSFFKFMSRCGQEEQRPTNSNFELSQETESQIDLNSDTENIIIEMYEEPLSFDEKMPENEAFRKRMANTELSSSIEAPSAISDKLAPNETLPTVKKRKATNLLSSLETENKQIDNVLMDVSCAIKSLNNTNKSSGNKFDIFGQYLASELKDLDEQNANKLMEDIQELIINYKRSLRFDI